MGVRGGDAPLGTRGLLGSAPLPGFGKSPDRDAPAPGVAQPLGSGPILPRRSVPPALNVKRGPRCSWVLKYYFCTMKENVDKPNGF